jgi:stage V sporulation protein AB
MLILKHIASVIIGLGSGLVISGAVFAFITMIGVVTRLAQKSGTGGHVRLYESAIMLGGIMGCVGTFFPLRVPLGVGGLIVTGLCGGVFYGVLAMSLAEVLDVIPILSRRAGVRRGLFFFVLAVAVGKMLGSLLYFLKPGFFEGGP